MASVTSGLGFAVTASATFEHPYPLARHLSTLDHLTKGRGLERCDVIPPVHLATSARVRSPTTIDTSWPRNS
nr:hypothetical protein [Rhodococcus opacus]